VCAHGKTALRRQKKRGSPMSPLDVGAQAANLHQEAPAVRRGKPKRPELRIVESIRLDHSRDALLTAFGKKTLEDRYLLPGESFQDMFARVARAYADDIQHAQRIYDYISRSEEHTSELQSRENLVC